MEAVPNLFATGVQRHASIRPKPCTHNATLNPSGPKPKAPSPILSGKILLALVETNRRPQGSRAWGFSPQQNAVTWALGFGVDELW